jgi:endonuclease/exonuclease/phosphatase family metal-dependent hydrolase
MSRVRLAWLLLLPAVAACGGEPESFTPESPLATREDAVTIPAKGTSSTLDFGTWNIEWFGDTSNGPTNDSLQLSNVRDVIAGSDLDIWGVQEVVDTNHFNNLVSQLSGYTGFLANNSIVVDGAAYYSDFSNTEQKVGVIYKGSLATVTDARIILKEYDYDFAGRPPLQVTFSVSLNSHTESLVVIVMHTKCCTDTTSWQRRQNASNALKSYLDSTFPSSKVVVIGDYNDDLDTSITSGMASPYKNFVDDTLDYFFPTKALTDAGISTTTSYPDAVDHHLVTNEVQALYVSGSVEAYRVDQYITNYGNTTSDHFPVLSRYNWGSGGGGTTPTLQLSAPNGGESWTAGSSQAITWSASNISNVKLEYSLDNGSTWSLITSSTSASTGSYTWTVPSTTSTQARVRVSDASNASLNDISDATFSIVSSTSTGAVFMNEVLANEPGSDTSKEFIEIVNTTSSTVDLSGWKVSDSAGVRHTFASSTLLGPGKVILVYGASKGIPRSLKSISVAASSGSLGLNNDADTVTLAQSNGTVVDQVSYTSSLSGTDGVSMNRSPDVTPGSSFVLHTALSSLSSSAGTRVDGSAF